ncbi:MAG: SUMF1/EgtB/PvdO family nonheme iron enzyme [Deltaproteobacteria bacterium]|nr:SUMF1/EgtB/PvdO family nonheme iron enzyme [Deltaproteobacteria bacterium]
MGMKVLISRNGKLFGVLLSVALLVLVGCSGGGGGGDDDGDLQTWYLDSDGDGYGDPAISSEAETRPAGYVADNTDCDDGDAAVNPGAAEICADLLDNNCNLDIDCDDNDCSSGTVCTADYYNSLGMGFNLIPAGTFTMGSPDTELGRDPDETEHQVTLTQNFYMQVTEVTQGQWEGVMGTNPSRFQNCGPGCPVEQVSWQDANDFVDALNLLGEGTYRLPTEAEWEYAARAGSASAFANDGISTQSSEACAFEEDLDVLGWYCFNDSVSYPGCEDFSPGGPDCAGTTTVGQQDANAWGLHDMHGSVWEWCRDRYGDYAGDETDPAGPATGEKRVIRSGSWLGVSKACRSANRAVSLPAESFNTLGFRVVLDPNSIP